MLTYLSSPNMVYRDLSPIHHYYIMSDDEWIAELERQLAEEFARRDENEWEGTIAWDQVAALPRGLALQGKASGWDKDVVEQELRLQLGGSYPNGTAKYRLEYRDIWHVYHQCPCGHTKCDNCVILHTRVSGQHAPRGSSARRAVPPRRTHVSRTGTNMVGERCLVKVSTSMVSILRKWSEFTFPFGRELRGTVVSGKEMQTLQSSLWCQVPRWGA